MPEKKKYVTLDQLQRFYKRITHDDSIEKTPIATFDNINYYSSYEWNAQDLNNVIMFYDYKLQGIASISENEIINYTGSMNVFKENAVPPATVFTIKKGELQSSPVMVIIASTGPIEESGTYTINDIHYYVDGDFQSTADGIVTVSHFTIYVGALPKGEPVSYTCSNGIIVDNYSDPIYASQVDAYLDLHLMPLSEDRLGIVAIEAHGETLFESSDYCEMFNQSNYDSNLVDPEQSLAQCLLGYYLPELAPYRIKCFIHNPLDSNFYFTTTLEGTSDKLEDLNHINDYHFTINANGFIDTNLIIATDPVPEESEEESEGMPTKIELDICSINHENNTTALVLSGALNKPVLLPINQKLVTILTMPDMQKMVTWQFIDDNGKYKVTASLADITETNTETTPVFNIAPTVTLICTNQNREPQVMPANLQLIFSDDGWQLQEFQNPRSEAYGLIDAKGCCTIEPAPESRFYRMIDIWGPCTIYYESYNPWAL